MEEFKEIPSFPDYEVSNYGRVRTKARKVRYTHAVTKNVHYRMTTHRFLKVQYNKRTGYKMHQLYKNKKMYNKCIHRLVAETFIEKVKGFDHINHKDGNKHNNVVENLEWCTNEYNHAHATATGLKASGSGIGTSKLSERCVIAINNMLKDNVSKTQISRWFNVSRATIILISQGKTWRQLKYQVRPTH